LIKDVFVEQRFYFMLMEHIFKIMDLLIIDLCY